MMMMMMMMCPYRSLPDGKGAELVSRRATATLWFVYCTKQSRAKMKTFERDTGSERTRGDEIDGGRHPPANIVPIRS